MPALLQRPWLWLLLLLLVLSGLLKVRQPPRPIKYLFPLLILARITYKLVEYKTEP